MLGLNNDPPRDFMEKGKDWALSAIGLDKELVEPHVSLAICVRPCLTRCDPCSR
jgi:hypothetical protein